MDIWILVAFCFDMNDLLLVHLLHDHLYPKVLKDLSGQEIEASNNYSAKKLQKIKN